MILSHAAVKQEPDILQIFLRYTSITLGVEHLCKQLESPNPHMIFSWFSRHSRIKSIPYTYFLQSPFIFFLMMLLGRCKPPKLRELAKHTYKDVQGCYSIKQRK